MRRQINAELRFQKNMVPKNVKIKDIKDVIVFTNKTELDTYNEMLLNGFMKYLCNRQKKTHDVVYVGAKVTLMQDEHFVKNFLSQLHLE